MIVSKRPLPSSTGIPHSKLAESKGAPCASTTDAPGDLLVKADTSPPQKGRGISLLGLVKTGLTFFVLANQIDKIGASPTQGPVHPKALSDSDPHYKTAKDLVSAVYEGWDTTEFYTSSVEPYAGAMVFSETPDCKMPRVIVEVLSEFGNSSNSTGVHPHADIRQFPASYFLSPGCIGDSSRVPNLRLETFYEGRPLDSVHEGFKGLWIPNPEQSALMVSPVNSKVQAQMWRTFPPAQYAFCEAPLSPGSKETVLVITPVSKEKREAFDKLMGQAKMKDNCSTPSVWTDIAAIIGGVVGACVVCCITGCGICYLCGVCKGGGGGGGGIGVGDGGGGGDGLLPPVNLGGVGGLQQRNDPPPREQDFKSREQLRPPGVDGKENSVLLHPVPTKV